MSENTTEDFEAPFVVTLKGGTGYEKPWIVIRGNSAAEAVARLAEAKLEGLLEKTAEYAADFQAQTAGGTTGSPSQSGPSAQRQQAAAPSAAAPSGDVTYHPEGLTCGAQNCGQAIRLKQGVSKKGNAYKIWTCPNQKATNDGHFSEYIR